MINATPDQRNAVGVAMGGAEVTCGGPQYLGGDAAIRVRK
jgi:hypothetical protein